MSISSRTPFDIALADVQASRRTAEDAADELVSDLSDDEVLWLLDGDIPRFSATKLPAMMKAGPVTAAALPRIGFPGIKFSDGPRGVVMGASTSFSGDDGSRRYLEPDLERQVGEAMGLEARAQGANYSGAVCINLLRHPAWGRAQECYGEDPVLIGAMGVGLTAGLRPNVMACVKHFALNSMENARFKVDVSVDESALHEVYLPHFKAVVRSGAESVMSAYNAVNGCWAGESKALLTEILREEWGFAGFVTSDWVWGIRDGVKSLEAGMDIEMPLRLIRARELPKALREGLITRALAERSAKRILATTLRHFAQRSPSTPPRSVVACRNHRSLARLVAARGMVLLQNDRVQGETVLPIDPSVLRSIAIIGGLATEANTGDHGSSNVHPPSSSSPLDGLREALPGVKILHSDGADASAAAELASRADIAIVVAGMTHDDEGESVNNDNSDGMTLFGFPFTLRIVQWLLKRASKKAAEQFAGGGDRRRLNPKADEEALLVAVAQANPRTVAVLIGGSAILVENWRDRVPAILMAWYPGMEGGRAIADVLTGVEEPGGRLPFAIPTNEAHLPYFDADASAITYDAWWGQRLLDRDGRKSAFRLGHGLGYSQFAVDLIAAAPEDMAGSATVRVANIGDRDGATVVQLYAFDASAGPPIPQLVGFKRVALAARAVAQVEIDLDLTPLHMRTPATRLWTRRPGDWRLMAAQVSPDSGEVAGMLAAGSTASL